MVSKWQAKRAEAEAEEAEEAEAARPQSLEELELAKRRRLNDWEQSLSTEATQANSNFTPLAGRDWRARVKSKAPRRP